MEYKKLRDSLDTIQSVCERHKSSCCTCPLCIDGYSFCGVLGKSIQIRSGDYKLMPRYWNILPIKLFDYNKHMKEDMK